MEKKTGKSEDKQREHRTNKGNFGKQEDEPTTLKKIYERISLTSKIDKAEKT